MLFMLATNVALPIVAAGLLDEQPLGITLDDTHVAVLGTVGFALAVGVVRLFRTSLRYDARSAADVMRLDPRPPVIYLRSFRDDGEMLGAGAVNAPNMLQPLMSVLLSSPEQELAFNLRRIGPLVALR